MLEISHITRKYLRRTAVDDACIRLDPGRTCLLLGPNGSGKTTLMKMIAGLVHPTSGEITLDGDPIGTRTKASIAYMPTENYFYNYMTIGDAGRYYADFFADFDRRKFDGLLADMELDPKDKIRQLSSGMSAKLRLALTLSRDAKLMMFDEPLNGVDILTRSQVVNAIMENRTAGRTMLISTHLVDELEELVDYAVFMRRGKVALQGKPSEIVRGKSLKELYIEIYGHASAAPAAREEDDEEC